MIMEVVNLNIPLRSHVISPRKRGGPFHVGSDNAGIIPNGADWRRKILYMYLRMSSCPQRRQSVVLNHVYTQYFPIQGYSYNYSFKQKSL